MCATTYILKQGNLYLNSYYIARWKCSGLSVYLIALWQCGWKRAQSWKIGDYRMHCRLFACLPFQRVLHAVTSRPFHQPPPSPYINLPCNLWRSTLHCLPLSVCLLSRLSCHYISGPCPATPVSLALILSVCLFCTPSSLCLSVCLSVYLHFMSSLLSFCDVCLPCALNLSSFLSVHLSFLSNSAPVFNALLVSWQ